MCLVHDTNGSPCLTDVWDYTGGNHPSRQWGFAGSVALRAADWLRTPSTVCPVQSRQLMVRISSLCFALRAVFNERTAALF